MPECPQCHSQRVWKDGLRETARGPVQRWTCRDCGYRFSETFNNAAVNAHFQPNGDTPLSFSDCPEHSERLQKLHTLILKTKADKTILCRVGASDNGAKNLVEVETRTQEKAAGATMTPQDVKGRLIEFMWFMKKEAYAPDTIKGRADGIRNLANSMASKGMGDKLLHSEVVKAFISEQDNWDDGYKRNMVYAYTTFLTMHGLSWNPPHYKVRDKLPFIPLESELNQLIVSTGRKMSIFLHGLKETAADPGELFALKWTDINTDPPTITINHPVKGHKARIVNVNRDFIDRLGMIRKENEKVFQGRIENLRRDYRDQRKNVAKKFNNPRLLRIKFTTFRHWRGTWDYHMQEKKDPYEIMKLLGHHSLSSTEIYINLEQALFKEARDKYDVETPETIEDAARLLAAGYKPAMEMNGKQLMIKPKDYSLERRVFLNPEEMASADHPSTPKNTPVTVDWGGFEPPTS